MNGELLEVGQNLWRMRFPLRLAGVELGRNVWLARDAEGGVLIHSTAPFTKADVRAVESVGQPKALVDVTRFHDTFAKDARRAFPDVPYLAPGGVPAPADSLEEWIARTGGGGLEWRELEGMPKVREHAAFHAESRTLILADLCFHPGEEMGRWSRWFLRHVMGIRESPGMSRMFRMMIRDREAFARSLKDVLAWDFRRIAFGHGEPLDEGAREGLERALERAGFG